MGGTSNSTQQQTSQASPYAPATGALNGILGSLGGLAGSAGSLTPAQSSAINTLTANGAAGDPNAAASTAGVAGLLSGGGANNNNGAISNNLSTYQGLLTPFANGSQVGANSALTPELNAINTGVTNQVNSQFAAAGRDGSPANSMALGMGIAQGDAPVIASQYNTDVGNQLNAASQLYGAGNSTYGLLNSNQAQNNANVSAGIAAAPTAYNETNAGANNVLNAQSMINGIPMSQLTTLLGSISPVAQAFGTQTGAGSGTNTMSGAQQFGTIASGIGSLMPKAPMSFSFG